MIGGLQRDLAGQGEAEAAGAHLVEPRPADAVRRFTADVGRQPPPAAPFYFGPWWQPTGDAARNIAQLRAAGALGSVEQTYTHYLPCGDQQGHTAEQQAMTAQAHDAGLAITMFREHEVLPWRGLPSLVPAPQRMWRLPDGAPRIPLSYSLRAKKG